MTTKPDPPERMYTISLGGGRYARLSVPDDLTYWQAREIGAVVYSIADEAMSDD